MFEFNYKDESADYIDPNNELAYTDSSTPYGKNFLTAYSKRFRKLAPPLPDKPEAQYNTVYHTSYVKSGLAIFFSLLFALAGLAVMIVMYFNLLAPQLYDFFKIGKEIVDKTGSGSLYWMQSFMVISAAMLLITIIVSLVAAGGKKRYAYGVPALIAFVVLLISGLFCVINVKFDNVTFTDAFINFKNPLADYEFAFLVDIPFGYYIVLLCALISFIVSLFTYRTKTTSESILTNQDELDTYNDVLKSYDETYGTHLAPTEDTADTNIAANGCNTAE